MKNVDAMRWVMEVDYHDLALNGITRDGLERLFANSATIHEADFLLQHPECEPIWKLPRCPS
ncbi:MAG: hypothetical protein WC708_09705 [Lentisphaeria bacterium]